MREVLVLRLMMTRTRIIRYTNLIGADPGAPSCWGAGLYHHSSLDWDRSRVESVGLASG